MPTMLPRPISLVDELKGLGVPELRPLLAGKGKKDGSSSQAFTSVGARDDSTYSGPQCAVSDRFEGCGCESEMGVRSNVGRGIWSPSSGFPPSRAKESEQMSARSAWRGQSKPPEVHAGVARRNELQPTLRSIMGRCARRTPRSAPPSASEGADA